MSTPPRSETQKSARAESLREHRTTICSLGARKRRGERFAMLTAYDYPFARIFDEVGIDILLVGDSLGNVVQGLDNTLPVTLDEMIYHTRMVARARVAPSWWATCLLAPTKSRPKTRCAARCGS